MLKPEAWLTRTEHSSLLLYSPASCAGFHDARAASVLSVLHRRMSQGQQGLLKAPLRRAGCWIKRSCATLAPLERRDKLSWLVLNTCFNCSSHSNAGTVARTTPLLSIQWGLRPLVVIQVQSHKVILQLMTHPNSTEPAELITLDQMINARWCATSSMCHHQALLTAHNWQVQISF
jgi:hypothetical protein